LQLLGAALEGHKQEAGLESSSDSLFNSCDSLRTKSHVPSSAATRSPRVAHQSSQASSSGHAGTSLVPGEHGGEADSSQFLQRGGQQRALLDEEHEEHEQGHQGEAEHQNELNSE
ncbi:unnamed protein product, partial [Amoebophrya sp. A25]